MSSKQFVVSVFLLLFPAFAQADSDEVCVYINEMGMQKQVDSKRKVPYNLRDRARCYRVGESSYLAAPNEIDLQGSKRRESMITALGSVEMQWPRSVEKLFGRTPHRAVADAARSVSRALKKPGFPTELQRFDVEWNIVFMDATLPETQIPGYLVSNCHPAWMTPPGNIYVVAQRVASGCGGKAAPPKSTVDAELAEVLAHEMGHAVETRLLLGNGYSDRMRAEGFATWFESYASDFSSVIRSGVVFREHLSLARSSFKSSPNAFHFQGSGPDYARASLYFHAIVKAKGIRGLIQVYDYMRDTNVPFFQASEETIGWDKKELDQRAKKVAGFK